MPLKNYDDVRAAFDKGTVLHASRGELEQLLLAVGSQRIEHPANQARAAEMGETMRQLLAARQSQEMHSQALRVSKVALWVALAALIASLIQAAAALNLLPPLSSLLQERTTSRSTAPPQGTVKP
ncbi:hypothetical protein [Polaromonas eurypsychrophila]|uniref:Uncharacterized protein n=1 Tax=Polaromonas eurypsychrophila TaxID=1614635 RepID=A0A916WCZ0_9BURK|nr:hypothetical protein [Polaromonas eurypsychrophila]GGA87386.1 hypothetical protein GCM10011496_05090 [Polaromonas eurypsychrophila]